MATETDPAQYRIPVTKERVFRAAIAVADAGGVDALTMRKVADELGVEPMSLYYHVANKAAMLDGVVEELIGEIERAVAELDLPIEPDDWKTGMRRRILAARQVMLRHKWAPGVIQTREVPGPTSMRYVDALIGQMRVGGFSYDLAHHALHLFGSRAFGFTQELFEPEGDATPDDETMAALEQMAAQLPNVVGMMMEIAHDEPDMTIGWCDDQTEFEFALDVMLDGLERLRDPA